MIREYLNACDAWFISWVMRDSWIICFRSWKFHFPEVFPTITDSKRPETCLPIDPLASMAFPSRSIIRTWQVIIFDILRSRSCDSQWPLSSALVVYRCSMENEIEILSSAANVNVKVLVSFFLCESSGSAATQAIHKENFNVPIDASHKDLHNLARGCIYRPQANCLNERPRTKSWGHHRSGKKKSNRRRRCFLHSHSRCFGNTNFLAFGLVTGCFNIGDIILQISLDSLNVHA